MDGDACMTNKNKPKKETQTQIEGADSHSRKLSQWYTPPDTARRIAEFAFEGASGKHSLLEPSAGRGNLLDACCETGLVDIDASTAVELDPANVVWLTRKHPGISVVCGDYMTVNLVRTYDVAVMNPPFEEGQTAKHILRALDDCLRVVCHCPLATLAGISRGKELWQKAYLNRLAICSSRPKYGPQGGKTDMCTIEVLDRADVVPFHEQKRGLFSCTTVEWWV
jgi:predicted RNA methylase